MRGRYPSGPEYVESLEGSTEAKRRAKVILQTVSGELRVQEACRLLAICEQRFQQLREEMLQAALARLEVRPAGRPRRQAERAEAAALQGKLAEVELELRLAQVREEIALVMPQALARPAAEELVEKKVPGRPKRTSASCSK